MSAFLRAGERWQAPSPSFHEPLVLMLHLFAANVAVVSAKLRGLPEVVLYHANTINLEVMCLMSGY